jgi:acyl-CoA thioesterase FadM
MVVAHHGPTAFGDALAVRTWVSTFKRDMMSDRQIRVDGPNGPVASATQRWVHVTLPGLKPSRAAPALRDAFGVITPDGEADVALPEVAPVDGAEEHRFAFDAWHTWMDPLAHANHPTYVDWADEALARILGGRGGDPQGLASVAEEMTWRSGVVAPERVSVTTRVVGRAGDAVVCAHAFHGSDERLCAEGTTVRRHADLDPDRLVALLG